MNRLCLSSNSLGNPCHLKDRHGALGWPLAVAVLFLGGCQGRDPATDRAGDFQIRAAVREAIEGGPVVIEVALSYTGTKPIDIDEQGLLPLSHVTERVPNCWEARGRSYLCIGWEHGVRTFNPGDKWTETLFLHHYYSNISPGRTKIALTWNARAPGPEGALLANPTLVLDFDLSQANPENLTQLVQRLQKKLAQPHLPDREKAFLMGCLQSAQHPELEPVAWKIIDSKDKYYDLYPLAYIIYSITPKPREADARFVDLAVDSGLGLAPKIFSCWQAKKVRLSKANVAKLAAADSIWTRALTYGIFPQHCDKEWVERFLREVRDLAHPLPPEQFAPFLRDLDDDSFIVREKGSATLEQLGERVEAHLKQALRTPLSLEAKRRVQSALEKIAVAPRPPDCDRVIRYLAETVRSPEADAVLAALAEGDPHLSLTKYAKTALKERQKPPSGK